MIPRDPHIVPMPERIALLPRDPRGYPWFFTVQNPHGEPTFLGINPAQVVRCARERLCGICGQPLYYWIHFVGGPVSCETREFSEPAMHPDCLEYAFAVCPYLVNPNYRKIEKRADRPQNYLVDSKGVEMDKSRIAIYRTRSYKWFISQDRVPLFRAAPAKAIIWRDTTHG